MTAPRTLRPTVTPRDSYAGAPRENSFGQIANSLSQLNGSLSRFTDRQIQVANEGEREQGREMARQLVEGGKTWAQAIKERPELAAVSGWVKMGVEETYGMVAGGRFESDLRAFTENNLANVVSLDEADVAITKYLEEWRENNIGERPSQFFEESFFNRAQAAISNMRNALAGQAAKNSSEVLLSGLFEGTRLRALEAFQAYRETGDVSLIEAAAANINAEQDRLATINPNLVKSFNKQLTEALNVAALEADDIAVRKLFGKYIKGGTGKLGDTREFLTNDRGELNDDEFYAARARRLQVQDSIERSTNDRKVKELEEQAVQSLLAGQKPAAILQQIAKISPGKVKELQPLLADVDDLRAFDDADTSDSLARELYERRNLKGFMGILGRARQAGLVSREKFVAWASAWQSSVQAERSQSGTPKDVADLPYYRNWKGTVERLEMMGSVTGIGALKSRFDRRAREWFVSTYTKKPGMSEADVERSIERLFQQSVKEVYITGALPSAIQEILSTASGVRPANQRLGAEQEQKQPQLRPALQQTIDSLRNAGNPDLNARAASGDPALGAIVRQLSEQGFNMAQIREILSGKTSMTGMRGPTDSKPSSGSKNE